MNSGESDEDEDNIDFFGLNEPEESETAVEAKISDVAYGPSVPSQKEVISFLH